jgi:Tol biopolymer transport system component
MSTHNLVRWFIAINAVWLQNIALASDKTVCVSVKDGNICLQKSDESLVQLTKSGKDRNPVLAPDGKTVVFIRQTDERYEIDAPADVDCNDLYVDQLWIATTNGKKKKIYPETSENVQIIEDSVHFSPDSKKIYFLTTQSTTSGAVHRVDINGSKPRFLIPGNSLYILPKGRYRGYLIVQQHRYFVAGGSYDWYWLFDSNGKEIGPIGPELSDIAMSMMLED